MIDKLKAHQIRPVKLFEDYLESHSVEVITPYWANRFLLECCVEMPLPLRQATWNALKEIYGPPFEARPLPYPLLTRYLKFSFAELWEQYTDSASRLMLIGVDLDEPFEILECKNGGFIRQGNRSIPATALVVDSAREYLSAKRKPLPLVNKQAAKNALSAELLARGVPETTYASIYGRFSAMKLQVPVGRLGLFKTCRPSNC